MTKFHNLSNTLEAFLVGSIVFPLVVSQALSGAGIGGEPFYLYWTFSVLALIPANVAYRKGRDFAIWYVYGICFWLIAFIHSLCIRDNDEAKQAKGWIKCPYCGEYSKPEATVCHCCGRELVRK